MEDTPEPMTCKHCKKPMEKSVWDSHVKLCLQKKQDKARRKKEAKEAKAKDAKEKSEDKDKDGDTQMDDPTSAARIGGDLPDEPGAPTEVITKSAKKSAAKATTDAPKKSKKRKADNEGVEKEPPKKKKAKKDEPPKPKVPKPKGPVDVEKQCGVQLPNGGNCARSLTCKSHSMGAKRSVPGRSLPYDLLLAQYQKKNQAKQQSMAHLYPLPFNSGWQSKLAHSAFFCQGSTGPVRPTLITIAWCFPHPHLSSFSPLEPFSNQPKQKQQWTPTLLSPKTSITPALSTRTRRKTP